MQGRVEEGGGGLGIEASRGVGCSVAGTLEETETETGSHIACGSWDLRPGPSRTSPARAQLEPGPQTSTEPGRVRCCCRS